MVVKWNERPNTEGGSALVNNAAAGKEVGARPIAYLLAIVQIVYFISYFQHDVFILRYYTIQCRCFSSPGVRFFEIQSHCLDRADEMTREKVDSVRPLGIIHVLSSLVGLPSGKSNTCRSLFLAASSSMIKNPSEYIVLT